MATEQPIRLFVSDVDGTLVRKDKTVAPATVEAAHRLLQASVAMTLISARPPSGILPIATKLGLVHPLGAFNGGTIVKPDGTILAAHRIDAAASRTAIDLIVKSGASPWAYADGNWYARDADNPHIPRETRSSMVEPIITDDFSALHGRIDKIVGVSDDPALIDKLEEDCQAALGDSAHVTCSQTYYCDIGHPVANKGDGIIALSEAIGIPLAETAAIGDMRNDIPMLTKVALAIAMGQAPDVVKDVADEVSTSNEEDGVAHAIEHFLLPEVARHRL